ncbi:hypothetical protein HPB50_000051 [Hyalomma asiaticum]|uniref:Uncharacterized protein n=1 Tax=Hyalomma asiaticum TaxID=266040 RepID=A0ACB7SXM8_HYAAI|nr:hypothetical protein HPB50_000051 [Hyalomma asiaticum]
MQYCYELRALSALRWRHPRDGRPRWFRPVGASPFDVRRELFDPAFSSNHSGGVDGSPVLRASSWGEGLFLMLETALIAALVMRYRGQTSRVLGFTASYTCLLAMLMMKVVPVPVLWSAQLLSLPVIICGKVRCSSLICL